MGTGVTAVSWIPAAVPLELEVTPDQPLELAVLWSKCTDCSERMQKGRDLNAGLRRPQQGPRGLVAESETS